MIDEVVKCYFEGGNWRKELKKLVKEEKRNEVNFNNPNSLHSNVNNNTNHIE